MRYSDPVEIIRDGKVINKSRNLRGLRRFCGKHITRLISIVEDKTSTFEYGSGVLAIDFMDGSFCYTRFASFDILKETIRNWRNLYGAPLWVNGKPCGKVSFNNVHLQ